MEATLYFIILAALFLLMMRYGCGAHVMGHGHGHGEGSKKHEQAGPAGLRWMPPASDIDPVCGKTVSTDTAKPSIHDGHVYYFCSQDCRERFEAAPDTYVKKSVAQSSKSEMSHV